MQYILNAIAAEYVESTVIRTRAYNGKLYKENQISRHKF